MGKATGFIEYQRQTAPDRPPQERVRDWNEFHLPLPDDDLNQQAARCMDCGVPFCHTGIVLHGAASGCPLNNLIPEWNDLVYHGLWRQALDRLHKTNNFPEFTGRVCPAPCEGSCTLGYNEPAVTIKGIECAIVDRGFEEGWIGVSAPAATTGKKVAVVGSGPAGLACAAQLRQSGHGVTVFEREDRVGGLLMYGIPNMKLDKEIVERRVRLMADEGVEFVTGTEVGIDIPAEKLMAEFDALVLCGGATRPRDLPVEGRSLAGVHFAMDYLTANTKRLLNGDSQSIPEELDAAGKDVIVIGGGDTGTDCVATSLRQGCRSLVQFEILERPPLNRPPGNPWPEWPRILRVDYGQEEAEALSGRDPRHFSILTKKYEGDEQGHLKAAHTVQVQWEAGDDGRSKPVEIPGTQQEWPAQLILLAMGFLGPEAQLLEQLGVEQDSRSNVRTGPGSYSTSVESVFAAGDMRRGQSLVVWAIREGRQAAGECDRYLMG